MRFDELSDTLLQGLAARHGDYGPAARRLLAARVGAVEASTRILADLTRRVGRDNETVRPLVHQQPGAPSDEDHALAELRRMYG